MVKIGNEIHTNAITSIIHLKLPERKLATECWRWYTTKSGQEQEQEQRAKMM